MKIPGLLSSTPIRVLLLYIFTVLLVSAWLWPFRPTPLIGFTQEILAFIAAVFLLTVLLLKKIRIPFYLFAALGLAAIPIFQHWLGLIPFAGNAWLTSIYLAAFALMLLVGYNLTYNKKLTHNFTALLASIFMLAAALSTWIALRQYLHLADSAWEINLNRSRPYANLAQPNNLSTLLGLGLAGCLYFYETRRLGGFSAGLLSAFLLLGLAITQSRTPWVTSLAILVFWFIKVRTFSPRLTFLHLCLWVGFYAFLVVMLPHFYNLIEFQATSLADRAAALERWSLWSQLWHAAWNGPFWGYGWNQTNAAQVSVTLEYPLSMMTSYSHNLVLDLLLWNGLIPGSIIVTVVGVWLLRLGWFARSKESLFALVVAGFILTHSMLEFPFAYAYFLLPLGLLLGIASVDMPNKQQFIFPCSLLLIIIIAGVWLIKLAITDYQIIKADHQAQRMKAANVIGFENKIPITEVKLLTQFRELQRFKAIPLSTDYSDKELAWMKSVVHQYPHLANLYKYALILRLNGQPKLSEQYLKLLCNLHGTKFCEQAYIEISAYSENNTPL